MSPDPLAAAAHLVGARIQRVDRVDDRTLSLEVRLPGRTVHAVFGMQGSPSLELHGQRPGRTVNGGDLQRYLRKRLVGQAWCGLRIDGPAWVLECTDFDVRLAARSNWVQVQPHEPSRVPPSPAPLPADFTFDDPSSGAFDRAQQLRRQLRRRLAAETKRLDRLWKMVDADRRRLEAAADAELQGERLKSVLHQVRRGQSEVEVVDWSTQAPVRVPLDPTLSPVENLERYFARAKKARRGLPVVASRLREVERERDRVRALLDELDRAPESVSEAELRGRYGPWLSSASKTSAEPSSREKARSSPPWARWARRFEASDQSEIWVGKNAKSNDRLTSSARGSDLWLHARGVTGAHVVIPQRAGHRASPEAVVDAAHLAIHFSEARNESKAEVMVAEARHVKKTKGAPPGQVGVSQAKTRLVAIEADRLRRLLGHTGPHAVRGAR